MLTVRDAKPLLALTTLLVPWDYFSFVGNVGWGLHFALVRFHATTQGARFFTLLDLFRLREAYGSSARIGLYLWILAGVVTTLAVVYVLIARLLGGVTERHEDRAIGVTLMAAAGLFVLRGVFTYDYLLFDSVSRFSIPFGAIYVAVVGLVFFRGRFAVEE